MLVCACTNSVAYTHKCGTCCVRIKQGNFTTTESSATCVHSWWHQLQHPPSLSPEAQIGTLGFAVQNEVAPSTDGECKMKTTVARQAKYRCRLSIGSMAFKTSYRILLTFNGVKTSE